MRVREAIPSDSARLVTFFRTLYSETNFMLFEPNELTVTEEQQARRLEECRGPNLGSCSFAKQTASSLGWCSAIAESHGARAIRCTW